MKTRILGLALAMVAMAPAAHAEKLLQFDFAFAGPNGSQPWANTSSYSEFREDGERTNVVNGGYDVIEDKYYNGFVFRSTRHYSTYSYDVPGYYRDFYSYNGTVTGPENGEKSVYLSGTINYTPANGSIFEADGAVITASMMIDGTYGAADSDESTLALPATLPTLSFGFGNNKADLMALGQGSAGNGRFFVGGFTDAIKIVPGTNQFEFLVTAPADVDPGNVMININGPAYNFGVRHFEQEYYTGSHVSIMPVPEPTTWAMLLAGVGMLGVARRRKTAA